jgi:predicted XRE-type DNA-binding protein
MDMDWLKNEIKRQKLSQKRIAERLGVTQGKVSNMEFFVLHDTFQYGIVAPTATPWRGQQ